MNKPTLKAMLACAVFTFALSSPLAAADETSTGGSTAEEAPAEKLDFAKLDANQDGGLSADEIPADHALAQDFPDVDSDGDGKLGKDEFDAYNQ